MEWVPVLFVRREDVLHKGVHSPKSIYLCSQVTGYALQEIDAYALIEVWGRLCDGMAGMTGNWLIAVGRPR